MGHREMYGKMTGFLVVCAALSMGGCTNVSSSLRSDSAMAPDVTMVVEHAPGVVDYVWEEPMVDSVEVPAGLDPEGHYYRPSHKQLREIRQGRWQAYSDN
jgi:uncharacterized lipoprotein YmbA